jgi:5-methylcytosine-specific restriction endonuclease McrA
LADFVRDRDQGICRQCGTPESRRVDHIIRRRDGGADADWNLQLLCDDCDAKKHREKGEAWR